MKQWLKRITGIEAEEQRLEKEKIDLENEKLEKMKVTNPKEYATRMKEPWIEVTDIKVNKSNVRNGFFELDWNRYFIDELIRNGYGYDADPEEEIVDRWFRDIVYNMLEQENLDTSRGYGYINVVPINKNQSEVS